MTAPASPATSTRSRRLVALVVAVVAIGGGGAAWLASLDGDSPKQRTTAKDASTSSGDAASSTRFAGLREYVDAHTADLVADTAELERVAAQYEALVERHDGDYAAVAREDAPAARSALVAARAAFMQANPAYEEMEGVVAGVPSLAKYDVSIDAGSAIADGADGAVEFDVQVDDARTLDRPGNYFLLTEATLYGTEPDWSSGERFDVDADGATTQFGDVLPDAAVLAAVTRDFAAEAGRLQADAGDWTPNEDDAFTALVVMTPTMAEYFDSWKQSRFVAGDASTERGFVAASRLDDVVGILGGLEVIRTSLADRMTDADPAASSAIERDLAALTSFVADLRARERAGRTFTPAQADRYGADAQAQAEQVTARIADTARQLGVEVAA